MNWEERLGRNDKGWWEMLGKFMYEMIEGDFIFGIIKCIFIKLGKIK